MTQHTDVAGPRETVKFVDESTADPVEKARRYLKAMGDPRMNSAYFFDDGYPRRESSQDALATLAVLEQLSAAPQTDRQPAVQQWNDLIGKETHADADGLLVWRDEVDFAIPTPQADSQPALPKITAADRSFLHYNPNTDDIVEWVQHYASAAITADRAARAPADSVLEDAARYRFLSGHCRSTSEHWGGRWSIIVDGPAPKSHDSEDDFDEAVDAASKQGANHD